jgi:arginine deiminase
MATLTDLYITEKTLETLLNTIRAKKEKGVSLTISISDDVNTYGQNVSSYVSQTKEQREAKANKFYVGNGKVFWTDGKVVKPEKGEKANTPTPTLTEEMQGDELPF